jgi:hypothetical protein
MFGKPHWFRPKRYGWGLKPIAWQGWAYALVWTLVLALPFLLLLARQQPVEAALWLALSLAALGYDVGQILRAIRGSGQRQAQVPSAAPGSPRADDRLLYIGDSAPVEAVATRNFRLGVRRR